ncbi:MFS transporter [Candidatus Bathyarchaeota archaeon]|nr:MFS transporter [Candidatus Bathyarchaeota archaeon]
MFRNVERNLVYLFALNIAFGLASQLINPLFPLFLEGLGASEVQNAMVISAGNLAATLLMLPSGLLIDRVGRKTLLLTGAALSTVSVLLLSIAGNWEVVLPIYVLFSVAGAFFLPARMAMIADTANSSNRASLFGVMNLAWPITGIISPVLSGYLVEFFSWRIVFLIAGAINALSLIPAFLIKRKGTYLKKTEKASIRDIFKPTVFPILAAFFLFHFLMTTGLGGVNQILPLFLKEVHGLTPSMIGLFFTAPSFVTLLTQVPSGKLADRFGKKRLLISCVTFIPFLYASWFFIDNWLILLVVNSVSFGLWSMTWPATLALLSDGVPDDLRGAAFGVRMTGVRLGFTVGPIIGSYFYSSYFSTSPFLAAAGFTLLGLVVAFTLKDKVPEKRN